MTIYLRRIGWTVLGLLLLVSPGRAASHPSLKTKNSPVRKVTKKVKTAKAIKTAKITKRPKGVKIAKAKTKPASKIHPVTKGLEAPEIAARSDHQLQAIAARIDQDTQGIGLDNHVELLAERYQVPLSIVEDLKKQGQGWGNISVALAMADALHRKDPTRCVSNADALNRLALMRLDNPGWSQLSQRAGLPLQPIVQAAARSYNEQVSARARAANNLDGASTVALR